MRINCKVEKMINMKNYKYKHEVKLDSYGDVKSCVFTKLYPIRVDAIDGINFRESESVLIGNDLSITSICSKFVQEKYNHMESVNLYLDTFYWDCKCIPSKLISIIKELKLDYCEDDLMTISCMISDFDYLGFRRLICNNRSFPFLIYRDVKQLFDKLYIEYSKSKCEHFDTLEDRKNAKKNEIEFDNNKINEYILGEFESLCVDLVNSGWVIEK